MAGLDEVGRGAWAGPVSVGVAVVRPRVQLRSMPRWLRDSKMLSESRREEIFEAVGRWCGAWAVGHASPAECDAWGMTEALRVAARRALAGLPMSPDAVLVDGPVDLLRHPEDRFSGVVRPVVDGDAKCASVAAASVLAKVVRDRLMRARGGALPALRVRPQQGLPVAAHQLALRGYGPSAIHRRSWAYVRDLPWCGDPVATRAPRARRGVAQRTRLTSAKWQATGCPWPRSTRAGSSWAQMSCAFQQRVRKRQPEGGDCGLGTSPWRTMCSRDRSARGSGIGTAERRAWV